MNNSIIPEEVKGTVLEEILQVSSEEIEATRQDLVDQLVLNGDHKISEMSLLEKKILSLIFKKDNEFNQLVDAVCGDTATYLKKGEILADIEASIEMLKHLVYSLLRSRLKLTEEDIIVREDFQIVIPSFGLDAHCETCSRKESCKIYAEAVRSMIGPGYNPEAN